MYYIQRCIYNVVVVCTSIEDNLVSSQVVLPPFRKKGEGS